MKKIAILVLVIIVILMGIYTWKLSCSDFDSNEFNNIATPFIALSAAIIYAIALFHSIKQNKIILSQGINPFYDKEIDKLIKKAKKIEFVNDYLYQNEKVNALNYVEYITKSLISLSNNKTFMEEYNKEMFENNEIYKKMNSNNSNYAHETDFLYQFTVRNEQIMSLYGDIKSLIIEINRTSLIKEHKQILKSRIKRELKISKYIDLNANINSYPKIPLIYHPKEPINSLRNTSFGDFFEFFNKELDSL